MEDSLKRLGIDHLDLAFLHNPDVHIPPEEVAEAFLEIKRCGLTSEVGLSNPAGLAWSEVFTKIAGNKSQEFFSPLKPRIQKQGIFSPKAVNGIFARPLLFQKGADDLRSRLVLNPKLKSMYFDSRMVDLGHQLARY